MALIRCPECCSEVSDQATACPRCGFPVASRAARANAGRPAYPPSAKDQIQSLLKTGNKIEAIRVYRELTNCGLKESKDEMDRMEADMRGAGLLSTRDQSVETSTSKFFLILIALLFLLAGIFLWMMHH